MFGNYGRSSFSFMFLVFLIFGLYLINYSLKFFSLPAAVDPFNRWIILISGGLLILGAFNVFRINRLYRYSY